MTSDPSARRARNLVVLVILFVAIPSLLLTGLATLAIENEEAAAKKRLAKLYKPVGVKMAHSFNARVDRLLSDSNLLLAQLAELGIQGGEPKPELLQFFNSAGFAGNYFVINAEGRPLLPRGSPSGTRIWLRLSSGLVEAIEYQANIPVGASGCDALHSLVRGPTGGAPDTCLAGYALALCLASNDEAYARGTHLEQAQRSCELADGDQAGVLAARLAGLSIQREQQPAPFVEQAQRLADMLLQPAAKLPPLLAEVLARTFSAQLNTVDSDAASAVIERLQAAGNRAALLEYFAGAGRWSRDQPVLEAVRAGGWRRVVLSHNIGGAVAGFELLPSGFNRLLREDLVAMNIDSHLQAKIASVESPNCCGKKEAGPGDDHESLMVDWVFLKKTDLAWAVFTSLEGGALVAALTYSRSGLYTWALVLIVGVLVAGILYTVRAVMREARFSRLKTDFVSSVSHDLRTPLTSIRMFTETLLLGRVQDEQEGRECLKVIAKETERLSRLTERILDFSRMEAGRKAYTFRSEQLGSIITEALAACRPLVEEAHCTVDLDLPDNLPELDVDRDAIIEVFVNLLANAIKYSPGERHVKICAWADVNVVRVSMSDRGIGITKADQRRIFEKFYRADCRRTSEVGGSGIGLSLVRYILDAHGCDVAVESAPGKGSTFTVCFPMAETVHSA